LGTQRALAGGIADLEKVGTVKTGGAFYVMKTVAAEFFAQVDAGLEVASTATARWRSFFCRTLRSSR
jgi:hypothetical protein